MAVLVPSRRYRIFIKVFVATVCCSGWAQPLNPCDPQHIPRISDANGRACGSIAFEQDDAENDFSLLQTSTVAKASSALTRGVETSLDVHGNTMRLQPLLQLQQTLQSGRHFQWLSSREDDDLRQYQPAFFMMFLVVACSLMSRYFFNRYRQKQSSEDEVSEKTGIEENYSIKDTLMRMAPSIPPIIIGGIFVGITVPIDTYISLNFFSQKYTDLNADQINCENTPDVSYCKAAVADNVTWKSISGIMFALVNLALGPQIGVLSDAYGRKPILGIVSALHLVPAVAQALFVNFNVTLYWYYALLPLHYIPSMGTWFAYISDLLHPKECAGGFGLLLVEWEVSMFVGMAIGLVLPLREALNVALVGRVLWTLYLLLILPESFPAERRKPLKLGQLVPMRGLSILIRDSNLRILCTVFVTAMFVGHGIESVSVSYFQKYLSWAKEDNYGNMMIGQLSVLVWMGCVLQQMLGSFGELGLLFLALIGSAVFQGVFYFVSSASQVFQLTGALFGATALMFPITAALKNSLANEDEQGQMQGAMMTVKTIALGLGPVFFGSLFNILETTDLDNIERPSKFIFILGALLTLSMLPLAAMLPRDILSDAPMINAQ